MVKVYAVPSSSASAAWLCPLLELEASPSSPLGVDSPGGPLKLLVQPEGPWGPAVWAVKDAGPGVAWHAKPRTRRMLTVPPWPREATLVWPPPPECGMAKRPAAAKVPPGQVVQVAVACRVK